MALTSYTELKTTLGRWLARSDLATNSIDADLIALAEAKFRRDPRLQYVVSRALAVSSETTALPSDFKAIVSLYGDSDAIRGPIEIVPPEKFAEAKAQYGDTGTPCVGMTLEGLLYLAPAPQQSYDLTLVYEAVLDSLSGSVASNWLLASHPDVYLYGALVEAAPYLQEDERVQVWKGLLDTAIEEVALAASRARYGGRMTIRPRQAIG